MKNILSIKNLSKIFKVKISKGVIKDFFRPTYKEVQAVNDLTFDIQKGESVAFLGPNGAGKTTTIKMLSGLIYPTSGQINVLGYKPQERDRNFLRKIGLVMGNRSGLNFDLTANQSFQFYKQIYQIPNEKFNPWFNNLVNILQVRELLDVQIRKLSLGQRMKMEIIGSILHKPEILFLDEPTIGLDIPSKNKIQRFLKETQNKDKTTMILTSHDMSDVENVCERVIIINHGRKVYDGNLKDLQHEYSKEKYVKFYFKKSITDGSLLEKYGANITQKEGHAITLKVKSVNMPKLISDVTSYCELDDIDIIGTPLEAIIEDIFNRD